MSLYVDDSYQKQVARIKDCNQHSLAERQAYFLVEPSDRYIIFFTGPMDHVNHRAARYVLYPCSGHQEVKSGMANRKMTINQNGKAQCVMDRCTNVNSVLSCLNVAVRDQADGI